MTTFSPHTVGRVATRRSILRPLALMDSRPSCGLRRSAMSMSLMIFSRLVTPDAMALGERMISCSTPSIRYRIRRQSSAGSTWMSLARSWIAWVMSMLTYLTIGASSTISRTLVSSSSSSSAFIALVMSSMSASARQYRSIACSRSSRVATIARGSRPVI